MKLRKNRRLVTKNRLRKGREKLLLSLLKTENFTEEEKIKIEIKIAINNPGYYKI